MAVKGTRLVKKRLNVINRNVSHAVMQELDDIADDLLDASRKEAPRDTDKMIGTAETDSQDRRKAGSFERSVFYRMEYALYQHELVYNPGEKTARYLGSSTAGVGRYFLSMPFLKMKPTVRPRLTRVIRKAIAQSVR